MTTHSCRLAGNYSTRLALAASLALFCRAASAQFAVIITNLVSFNGANGQQPAGVLLQASDGNFYGTTTYGGTNSAMAGTVYRMSTSGAFSNMVSFTAGNPNTGVIEGSDGNLYGTTTYAGAFINLDTNHNGFGSVFQMTKGGSLSTFASLNGTLGASPNALVETSPGVFYGTANQGGAFSNFAGFGYGTVFKATTAGVITDMVSFDDANGATPTTGLLVGGNGALYGATSSGGPYEYGTVFRLNPSGSGIAAQFNFNFTNGAVASSLLMGRDGNLYGTAIFGAKYENGAIFKLDTNLTQFSILATFNNTNGGYPTALIQASDGNFYGVTSEGSAHGYGNIFEMTTNNVIIPLYSFTGGSDGFGATSLVQGKDGNLYGTTEAGGSNGMGNVFKATLIPVPLIKSITMTNNKINLNWTASAGMNYDVQYCSDLSSPNWSKLGSTVATSSIGTMSDSVATGSKRFYRVVLNLGKPAAPMIQSFVQKPQMVTFSFVANPGSTYQVQYSADLKNWSMLQTINASNSMVNVTDTTVASVPKRFYRLAVTGQ